MAPRRPMRIGLSGWQRESTLGDHRVFVRVFERADALGFDSVWFNHFHFHRNEMLYPDPRLLAAVFARTERLRVGTLVLVLPLHHPLLLAERIAQLDFQSGRRLDVGIGRCSTSPDQFAALGIGLGETRAPALPLIARDLGRPGRERGEAGRARPRDFQFGSVHHVAVHTLEVALQAVQQAAAELNDCAAATADEVGVARVWAAHAAGRLVAFGGMLQLVVAVPLTEAQFPDESPVAQEVERPVDG